MSNSTSIVPLVLWGSKPPTHLISVITCTYDQKTIVTGSSHGQIGLWDLRHVQNGGLKVVPRSLIFAHGVKIVDIACAMEASYEHPNVVSLAENGEICLWDIEDGLCLQMNVILGNHTALYSIQISRGSLKEWRLVLYGLYSDVYIIDSLSLQILYTLKQRVSSDWITAVCTLRPARKQEFEEILIGINISCCLKVWTLKPSYETRSEVVYEDESKILDCSKAKVIRANPFTQRTVLIIASTAWQIFDATDFSFIASLPAPEKIPLVSGDFVAANRVLVWNRIGKAYLYKLPSRYLLGAERCETITNDTVSRMPVLLCEFKESVKSPSSFHFPMNFSYGRRGPYYKLLIQGMDGGVTIWKVPDSEQADLTLSKEKENLENSNTQQHSEVTVSDEGVRKTILLSEPVAKIVHASYHVSLEQLWKINKPVGLIDNLISDESPQPYVTSSLYLPSQGKMVCGRSNGTIIIIDAIRAAIPQLLSSSETGSRPSFTVLFGHSGHVTCLLYPHDENPRYDKNYLISGGADFSVKFWDLATGTLNHSFPCHGGQVWKLLVTPSDCNSRFQYCICSIGQDHSVALLGLRERKILLLASRHTFPVETIRWRPNDDFMVVGCSDGTVYVWQMETGHLDRCAAGAVAMEILESCHEETSAPSLAVREHHRKFRLQQHLTNMAHHLPIDLKAPQMMKRMKSKMVSIHHQVTGHQRSSASTSSSHAKDSHGPEKPLPPMRVCPLRIQLTDPDIHVILLDPEALIRQLLTEEAQYFAHSATPTNPKRRIEFTSDQTLKERFDTDTVSYEIAQLLLSCIHAWGLDNGLDDTCMSKLGMLRPVKPLSFGLLTRGRLSLMLPGWYVSGHEDDIAGALEAGMTPEQIVPLDIEKDEIQKLQFNAHFQLSSSLTTQHLVCAVAVTNTLMSMNYFFTSNKEQKKAANDAALRSEVKAGWSLLAALHCCMLPDVMKGLKYRPPLLHILARRWQDRCLEIREAAQAILLAELRRIGGVGRKQLIDAWSPHLPQDIDSTDFGFEDLEQYMNNEENEKQVLVTAEEDRTDIAMVMMTTRKMVSSDVKLRHATSIIMLGVIGAEFQKEIDPVNSKASAENCMDVNVVRTTAKALTTLLLQRQSSKTPAYSAIRRAAIDLIGRGFALWEPHIDVSQVLMGLFELCADIESQLRQDSKKNFSMTAAKDLHRSAKHSLSLIATARPSACITTLAKEVARHVASTSSMSFTQPSPAAIAVYSHVRHQQQSTAETQYSNILHSTKAEILRIIELMIEKNQQQVMEFIVEVVDIIVHMLDFKQMKERGVNDVFPSLFKFSMVTYCGHTRRLAVGSRLGHIALYELRSSRCQLIPAHEGPVTALAFSPEGKVLASFSQKDKKISFYQTSSSLLGMLSSTIKCIQSFATLFPENPAAFKAVRILWTSKKDVVVLLGDGSQHKFKI